MEYRRAYWDEQPDDDLVRRHEAEIFPLLRQRRLFSGAENFAFYDFFNERGWVDENVFAFSNRGGGERAVILYNNAYSTTSGWIRTSTPVNLGPAEDKALATRTLAEALALNTGDHVFYRFRDHRTRLEYLRSGRQLAEEGLFSVLPGYHYHAFLDFAELHDADGSWRALAQRIGGNGVPGLDHALREMKFEPVLNPFRQLMSAIVRLGGEPPEALRPPVGKRSRAQAKPGPELGEAASRFYAAAIGMSGEPGEPGPPAAEFGQALEAILGLEPGLKKILPADEPADSSPVVSRVRIEVRALRPALLAWAAARELGRLGAITDEASARARERIREWMLDRVMAETFMAAGSDEGSARLDARLVEILVAHEDVFCAEGQEPESAAARWEAAFDDPAVQDYLGFNRFQDAVYLNQERLERMTQALFLAAAVGLAREGGADEAGLTQALRAATAVLDAARAAGWRVLATIRRLREG